MAAKSFLRTVAGVITQMFGVQTSAGAANAGDIPALDYSGRLHKSLIPHPAASTAEWFIDFVNNTFPYEGGAFSGISGGNGTASPALADQLGAFGVRIISNTTTANSGAYINVGTGGIVLSDGATCAHRVKLPAALIATTKARFGFQNAFSTADETHEVSFVVDGGVVTGRCRNASAQSSTTTLGSVVGDQWYTFKIDYTTTSVLFSVYDQNNALVSSESVTNNIPTNLGKSPGILATNSGTTAGKILIVDYIYAKNDIPSRQV